jgi:hypothetical protein
MSRTCESSTELWKAISSTWMSSDSWLKVAQKSSESCDCPDILAGDTDKEHYSFILASPDGTTAHRASFLSEL